MVHTDLCAAAVQPTAQPFSSVVRIGDSKQLLSTHLSKQGEMQYCFRYAAHGVEQGLSSFSRGKPNFLNCQPCLLQAKRSDIPGYGRNKKKVTETRK